MKKLFIFCLVLFITSNGTIHSQDANLKAFYTLNLIRYVSWNEQALQGDFIIAVVENRNVADQLRIHSAGKRFGHQHYIIREYNNLQEVNDCQVIYIGENARLSDETDLLIRIAQNQGVLLITESQGMIDRGSAVNFAHHNDGLRFELNAKNAGYANLQFSSRLEAMSAAINLR